MATYYIDYKNGNDTTGNGSTGTPWKTLTKALDEAANSDTILARGSDAADEIYYEYALSTALTSLTIGADTGYTPTWTPAIAYTSWTLTTDQDYTYETAYTPASCYYAWNGATQLTAAESIAEVEATANTFYADTGGDKLYVHITGGGSPTTIHACNSVSGLLSSAGTGITYSSLRMQWCGGGLYFAANGTATSCTVRYHGGEIYGSRDAITVDAAVTVTIEDCNLSGVYSGVGVAGTIGVNVATAGATVTVDGCTMSSLHYGVYSTVGGTVVVDDCTFSNVCDCVSLLPASGTLTGTVRNCTFANFEHGAVQFGNAGTAGTAHHNTAYYSGTRAHHNGYIAESGCEAWFYHNIAEGFENASGNAYGFYVLTSTTTVVLYNNLAVDCAGGYVVSASPTLTSDYNNAYGCAANFGWDKGAHDLELAPGFVDQSGHDFNLASDSSMIDAGVAVAGINDGYSGTAPDIGRYEYTEAAAGVIAQIAGVAWADVGQFAGVAEANIAQVIGVVAN